MRQYKKGASRWRPLVGWLRLRRMVKASIDHSLFSGFSVGARGREQVHILHLLFADDTLVFCGVSRDQVQAIGNL